MAIDVYAVYENGTSLSNMRWTYQRTPRCT